MPAFAVAVGVVAAIACRGAATEPTSQALNESTVVAKSSAASTTSGYSEGAAVEFAYLSTAAYCSQGLQSWECGPACSHVQGMQDVRRVGSAYVGRLRGQCVLAFRGTDSPAGWGRNLMSIAMVEYPGCSGCMVGAGFYGSYQEMAGGIREKLGEIGCGKSQPLAVTGHSFGAVMATLAIFDLGSSGYSLATSYTFGSPRLGNAAFAGAFNAKFAGVPVFRVSRADDPIVYVPFRGEFRHVGREIFYRGHGHRVCDGSGEDDSCAGNTNTAGVAFLLLRCVVPHTCGHYRYLQPRKEGMMIRGCHASKAEGEGDVLLP